jgi:hypothetical protein
MMIVLVTLTMGRSAKDLFPPFILDSNNAINGWVLSGSTSVADARIRLVPALQFSSGAAWFTSDFPLTPWRFSVTLQMARGYGGAGFGVWLVDDFQARGTLHGGPNRFTGIGFLGQVQSDPDGDLEICCRLVESSKSEFLFRQVSSPQDVCFPYYHDSPAEIHVDLLGPSQLSVTAVLKESIVYSTSRNLIIQPIDGYFLGITAQTGTYPSQIELIRAEFTTPVDSVWNLPPSDSKDISKSDPVARDVLSLISNSTQAAWAVIDFSSFDHYIREVIVPYSDKWRHRTTKSIQLFQSMMNVVESAWNYTELMMVAFNSSVEATIFKANEEIGAFSVLIAAEPENAISRKREQTPVLVVILVGISGLELLVFLAFALIHSNWNH